MTDEGSAVTSLEEPVEQGSEKNDLGFGLELFSIGNMEDGNPENAHPDPLKPQSQGDPQNKTPEPSVLTDGESTAESDSTFQEFQETVRKSQERIQYLEAQLGEKDLVIATLQRSCGLLEKETNLSKRELEIARKEKESTVMRYATVEKKVIDANVAKEAAEKRLKDGLKEIEAMNLKIRQINGEKAKMSQIVDQKCADIRHFQREVEKLKADISMWESTNKASTARLKQETDAKTAAEQKIVQVTAELEALKSADRAQMKSEVDLERLQFLEKQTVEQQAALILKKHEATAKDTKIGELEVKVSQMAKELSDMNERHSSVSSERDSLKEDYEKQKKEIFDLQNTLDREVLKVAELQTKVQDLETIRAQLRIERDSNAELNSQLSSTRDDLEETSTSLDKLRTREEELLAINRELTECTARLQNELSLHKSKSIALTLENESISKQKNSYDERYSSLEKQLEAEKASHQADKEILEKDLMESRLQIESLDQRLSTALGDIEAMKNKHNQSLKELNRELMLSQKRCAKLEQQRANDSDCQSTTSQSENVSDSESLKNGCNGQEASAGHCRKGSVSSLPGVSIMEPSKQSLIDRIVRLQQANAKQTEKLDFLENHSATLVSELQKKSKLVHYYMMRDQSGALSSSKSDKHKAELAKYGGIMSAIYGGVKGSSGSGDMTLELSLEINRKLQAVLEDTLLKNITLKENLDTLGLEVDKLTRKMSSK